MFPAAVAIIRSQLNVTASHDTFVTALNNTTPHSSNARISWIAAASIVLRGLRIALGATPGAGMSQQVLRLFTWANICC